MVQKKILQIKAKTKRKKYVDFSIEKGREDTLVGEAVNCDLSQGKIVASLCGDLYLINDVQPTYPFHAWMKEVVGYTDGVLSSLLYWLDEEYSIRLINASGEMTKVRTWFTQIPKVLSFYNQEGNETLIFLTEDGVKAMRWGETQIVNIFDGADAVGFVYHDRIFAMKDQRLYFCAPQEEENWLNDADGGGYLDLAYEGEKAVDACVWKDRAYIFFGSSAVRLSLQGSSRDFKKEEIFFGGGPIFRNSLCATEDGLYFLTPEGGFCFDGKTTKKVFDGLDFSGEDPVISVCFYRNSVYYSYRLADGSERIYVYHTKTGRGYFLSGVTGLCVCRDRLVGRFNGTLYFLDGSQSLLAVERSFIAEDCEFGIEGEKTLRTMKIKGKGNVRVAVSSERGGHSYACDLSMPAMICPLLKGKNFRLSFIPLLGGEVHEIEADISVL